MKQIYSRKNGINEHLSSLINLPFCFWLRNLYFFATFAFKFQMLKSLSIEIKVFLIPVVQIIIFLPVNHPK